MQKETGSEKSCSGVSFTLFTQGAGWIPNQKSSAWKHGHSLPAAHRLNRRAQQPPLRAGTANTGACREQQVEQSEGRRDGAPGTREQVGATEIQPETPCKAGKAFALCVAGLVQSLAHMWLSYPPSILQKASSEHRGRTSGFGGKGGTRALIPGAVYSPCDQAFPEPRRLHSGLTHRWAVRYRGFSLFFCALNRMFSSCR